MTQNITLITESFQEHIRVAQATEVLIKNDLAFVAEKCKSAINNGNKIIFFGNGGSAADANHLTAELTGRYKRDRKGLAAISLSADTSAITSIGNDYGFNFIFSRQIEALANEGDICIAISTSGNSENILQGLAAAKAKGVYSVGFLGKNGGIAAEMCDMPLIVPAQETSYIQEMHILMGHILCEIVEAAAI